MTFKERLMWSASLLATPRGIGWAHEPTDQIPPRPTASRGKFIVSQFLWIIFYFILWDVALIPVRENPCFKMGGPSLAAFGWWRRTVVWSFILALYCTLSGTNAILSIIFVASGLYEPRDCPHIFGSPLNAYTLRKCWGYVLTISFTLYPRDKNWTVASGTSTFANTSQATQIFLRTASISQEAHSRPTSNFSRHSLSLGCSMQLESMCSSRISLKGRPFNFSSSKQSASRSKTRLLVSPRAWDIGNPTPSS